MRSVLPVLSVLCAACAAEPIGAAPAPIVGGMREEGMPAVVAIINRATGGLCTGALVSPRVVLTAKHCVQGPEATELYPAEDFVVGIGPNVEAFEQTFDVISTETTPGVWELTDVGGVAGALLHVDVAVMTLALPAPIEPIAVHRAPIDSFLGDELTVFGYGGRPGGGVGEKWRTTSTVTAQTGNVLVGTPAVCGGDSGGPVLEAGGALVAVSSLGPSDCGAGQSAFNIVEPFLEMIDRAIAEAERCDPFAPGPLPEGWYCAREGCGGTLARGEPGASQWGEACDRDTDCVTLHCVDPGDGARRCLGSCRGGLGECLDGEACAAREGSCGACVDARLVSPRRLGEPCDTDRDCVSGACHQERLGIRYCTRACDDGCPTGFACRGASCVRDGDRADQLCTRTPDGGRVCALPPLIASGGGGCATSGRSAGGTLVPMLLVLVLANRRLRQQTLARRS